MRAMPKMKMLDAENDYGSKYEENEYSGNQPKSEKKKVKKVKLTKESLNALIGADEGKTQDDDARSIASHASARSVLSDVKSLRGIHSARSLAQLAKQTAKEMGKKIVQVHWLRFQKWNLYRLKFLL